MCDSSEFKKLRKYFKRKQWRYHQSLLDEIIQEMKKKHQNEKQKKIDQLQRELEFLRK